MKFGHLDNITNIDFSLPPDHPMTVQILNKKPVKKPKIYSGLAEWGNDGFPGKIYPKGTKPKDYLRLYAEQFNSIEQNMTLYRIPTQEMVKNWVSVVPKDFIFCPKVSNPVVQVKPLGRNRAALTEFCNSMHAFGDHLGTVFMQVHPTFSPQRYDDLLNFFDLWDEIAHQWCAAPVGLGASPSRLVLEFGTSRYVVRRNADAKHRHGHHRYRWPPRCCSHVSYDNIRLHPL